MRLLPPLMRPRQLLFGPSRTYNRLPLVMPSKAQWSMTSAVSAARLSLVMRQLIRPRSPGTRPWNRQLLTVVWPLSTSMATACAMASGRT